MSDFTASLQDDIGINDLDSFLSDFLMGFHETPE